MKSRFTLLIAYILATMSLAIWAIYVRYTQTRPPRTLSRTKPPWVYWSWRFFVPAVLAIFALGIEQAIVRRDQYLLLLVVACFGPFELVAISACFTVRTFSFDYSVFGRFRRLPFPDEKPLCVVRYSGIRVARVRSTPPFVTWAFYRQGVGIRISTVGDVFLPLDTLDTIELGSGFMGLSNELRHHCQEVRGPIGVPTRVAKIMAYYYPEKVLVNAKQI